MFCFAAVKESVHLARMVLNMFDEKTNVKTDKEKSEAYLINAVKCANNVLFLHGTTGQRPKSKKVQQDRKKKESPNAAQGPGRQGLRSSSAALSEPPEDFGSTSRSASGSIQHNPSAEPVSPVHEVEDLQEVDNDEFRIVNVDDIFAAGAVNPAMFLSKLLLNSYRRPASKCNSN